MDDLELKKELNLLRLDEGIITKCKASKTEEKKFENTNDDCLPSDYTRNYATDSEVPILFKYTQPMISNQEIIELLEYKKLNNIRTIKKCSIFFVIIIVITIIFQIIALVNILDKIL